MRGCVSEARDLGLLRGEIHDGVADQVDEPEGSFDAGRGEVPDRHSDVFRALLGLQLGDHRA